MVWGFQEGTVSESSWRKEYEEALGEVNFEKLKARVKAAEDAIKSRAASLNGQDFTDEHLAIEDALSQLKLLKRIQEEGD